MADYSTTSDTIDNAPETSIATGSTDTVLTAAFGVFITRASRLIDREVGKWDNYFYPSTDATIRYYDGSGEYEQEIDDTVSITTLEVAEDGDTDLTTWAATDYLTYPYNDAPIRKLVIDWNGDKGLFPPFRKCIKVTGFHGYSLTPPNDVKQACEIQAFRWYMRAKQGYQDVSGNADVGQTTVMSELDVDIKEILRHYKSRNIV